MKSSQNLVERTFEVKLINRDGKLADIFLIPLEASGDNPTFSVTFENKTCEVLRAEMYVKFTDPTFFDPNDIFYFNNEIYSTNEIVECLTRHICVMANCPYLISK